MSSQSPAWIVTLYKKDDKNQFNSTTDYFESTFQTVTQNDNSGSGGWAFNQQDQAYKYFEYKRFVTNLNNGNDNDLSNYALLVQSVHSLPSEMMLQVGNQWIESTNNSYTTTDGQKGHFFDLSSKTLSEVDGELATSDVGDYLSSGDDNVGVRTFTIQPMWTDNKMGQESIVVSFSPSYYTPTSNFTDSYQVFTSETGKLKNIDQLDNLEVQINGTTYEVQVGAIADYMLEKNTSKPLNIVINGRDSSYVDGNKILLSQNIIYRDKSQNTEGDWKMFTLGWNKPIAVTGRFQDNEKTNFMNNGALITGVNISNDRYENEFQQFYGGLLDVYSTYEPDEKSSDLSVEISGVTFTDTPQRGMGSVTANGYFGAIDTGQWMNSQLEPDSDKIYTTNLTNAIEKAISEDQFYTLMYGTRNTKVKFWDNQLITWNTKSDGFESLSPNLYSGKNFIKTNDDAIKMLSRNQQFIENTIHLGPDGAGMSFGYGFNNGPVKDMKVDGAYFHRVVQPGNGKDEDYSGLISDWMYWNKNLIGAPSENFAGIISPSFKDVYIPSMKNAKNYDANMLSRIGNVTAVVDTDRDYFRNKYPNTLNEWYKKDQVYQAGGYKLSDWNINLPTAPWFQANAEYKDDQSFNMGLNKFYSPISVQDSQWTLVMNKEDQAKKPNELPVHQYIDFSAFPTSKLRTRTNETNTEVIHKQGVTYFDLQDYETTRFNLSSSLKSLGRNFEFESGNQVKQNLKIDATDLGKSLLKLDQSMNKNSIINAGPYFTDYEISGIYLDSAAGNDHITGTSYSDFIRGGNGDDYINAGDGDDICRVGKGNDILNMGNGADTLFLTIDQLGQKDSNQILDFNFDEDRILIHRELIDIINIEYGETILSIGFVDAEPENKTLFKFSGVLQNLNVGFDNLYT